MRASLCSLSLLGARPIWRENSPATRSAKNRPFHRATKLVSQPSLVRITLNRSPASIRRINRARRTCAALQDCPLSQWFNSSRSACVNCIVSINTLDAFHALQFTSDQHLPGAGQRTDARADMHRDAAEFAVHALALAGMQAGPVLQPKAAQRLARR